MRRTSRSRRPRDCRASRTWPCPTGRSWTPGGRRDVRLGADRGVVRRELRVGAGDARLPARLQPAEARLRQRDVRPGAAVRAEDPSRRGPAGQRADRPAHGGPAPDHGRPHHGPLADRAVSPSSIVDRDNRENWLKAGGKDTYQRAVDELERRLAAYRPIETDPSIDAELRRIIASGLESQTSLPYCRRRRSRPRRRSLRSRPGTGSDQGGLAGSTRGAGRADVVTREPAGWDVDSPVQAEVFVVWLDGDRIQLTGRTGRRRGISSSVGPSIPSRSWTGSCATSSGRRCSSTRRPGGAIGMRSSCRSWS